MSVHRSRSPSPIAVREADNQIVGPKSLPYKLFEKAVSQTEPSSLIDANFLEPVDDFTYLEGNEAWLNRLESRIYPKEIKDSVITSVRQMMDDLEGNPERKDVIKEKVFSRGAEYTYLADKDLPELDFNQRKEVEAVFIATILRDEILSTPVEERDTNAAREAFKANLTNEYNNFMGREQGSDSELTYLFRFERAILLARNYINGNRNKGLFLSVANLLEGSDDHTRYVTGGHSSKETKRRVLLIEHLCEIKPRNLTRRASQPIGTMLGKPGPLSEPKFTESQKYQVFFEYQKAFSDNDLVLADKYYELLLSMDPNFSPKYFDKESYNKALKEKIDTEKKVEELLEKMESL